MAGIRWSSKLATVGNKSAAKIERAFGHHTVGDLLTHYPRRYVAKGELSDGSDFVDGEHITVIGRVVSARQHQYVDRRRGGVAFRLEVVVETQQERLSLTFFDKRSRTADWRAEHIVPGTVGRFSGRLGTFRGRWQLVHPETQIFTDEPSASGVELAHQAWENLPGLLALYPATASVQSWQIQDAIELALDLVDEVPDPVPAYIREKRGLLSARQALEWIHRPDTRAQLHQARETLVFQEAFVAQVVLAQRRRALEAVPAQPRRGRSGGLLDRFDERLPFTLTGGQQEVGEQIMRDLAGEHPMHRLLQGEVGSGKTVVALRAMLRVVDSGGQAALLAPTEVLGQQHYRSITALLGDLGAGGMLDGDEDATRVALLTGSVSAAARRAALADAASGAAGIVVGTHALLEERVQFADLGLVVVDEQHRFGVEQRAALTTKAGEVPPHLLVMTATPIPRTVAMTVFGDLETSSLVELPAGRAEVQTNVLPMHEKPQWLNRAWERVREEVDKRHQVYVVCPRIGGEELGFEDDGVVVSLDDHRRSGEVPQGRTRQRGGDGAPESRQAVTGRSRETREVDGPGGSAADRLAGVEEVVPLLSQGVLAGLHVEGLHGRMPPDRKDAVMRGFAAGDVDVLVSTTVVEVGVDVPNATMMVILDAERFGVSQLHQLRGRVARSEVPGLCLLVTRAETGSPALARLTAVAATTDGFELSRLDLEQRREGDVLGAAQSGRRSAFRLLSVLDHEDVIAYAREAAGAFVSRDPELGSEPALAAAVRDLEESDRADYLEMG